MTDRLRDNLADLNALVHRAAVELGMPAAYVEKDFWVTEVLRAACASQQILFQDGTGADVVFIFKGGTSLSRVFDIIDRFSEDVDLLALFPDRATTNARHLVLKRVDANVIAHLGLDAAEVTVESSTTGVKRYTTYLYPTTAGADGLKEGVLLELGSRGGTHPYAEHSYRSMVANYGLTLGENEDTWEEFAPFAVRVLAPERTLFEKLAAVHDASTRMDMTRLSKYGRHFYDIYRLLTDTGVLDALRLLGTTGIAAMVEDINVHSDASEFTWSARPKGGYAKSAAFDPAHGAAATIAMGFTAAQNLIHGTPVTLEEVWEAVAKRRDLL